MNTSPSTARPVTDEWIANHFDFTAPELEQDLYDVLARMRQRCPVTHSDAHQGYWVVADYEDVVRVAHDWRTFSSASYASAGPVPMVPIQTDPPEHTFHRRVVNPFFTPGAIARLEPSSREQASRLIDSFIDDGACEFMDQFARPFPGLVLFHELLHAPVDDIEAVNEMATIASFPSHPESAGAWQGLLEWVQKWVEERRSQPPQGDVVDAVLGADIDGRPLSDPEIYGTLMLLIMGGLETTSGALGQFIIRFAKEPEIPDLLRRQPELIPQAVEELLRLDAPFVALQRKVTQTVELEGNRLEKGDDVLFYLASANRDEAEFTEPDRFDLGRAKNRQIAFGVGPHRCVGSHLAKMNLRVALEELLARLGDIRLQDDAEPLPFHNAFSRSPAVVPITFTRR